ncbi:unnamed protein product [Effrenium voratum]|uniref:Palmitoyltransferase n=1 Tax=Effrenium voratum TaxID=2562239 RepID=A0AA36MHJ4_9DINO|nr:unnamed protein product [Effrenium voratum]CAJ1461244.1 unnamed protein product [Effrenium voratum]
MMLPSSSSYTEANFRSGTFSGYGSPYGSYKPAVQVGTQKHMGFGDGLIPTYPTGMPLMQPATAPYMSEMAPLTNGRLPPTTLLAAASANKSTYQESCAEEGWLDEDKFGAEDKGPSLDYTFWGIDLKPILPVALALSTVVGAICMMLVQIPILSRFTFMSQAALSAAFSVLYGITLGCMTYCTFADPGQVKKTRNLKPAGVDIEEGMPRRAHKSWQYPRPIRRYDHYCKWLQNVIGLLNHREFVTMLIGLTSIGLLGIVIDLWLAVLIAEKGFMDSEIVVVLHLAYSIALLFIEWPICRIHVGLVSRNETAQEWKKNENYVANNTSLGDKVPVEELDDDEYNELFDKDAFVYDRTRNPFDKGAASNCFNFWCMPRWPADEKGDW